jgi:hypothetical protein
MTSNDGSAARGYGIAPSERLKNMRISTARLITNDRKRKLLRIDGYKD